MSIGGFVKQSANMSVVSFILRPFCDGQHSPNNVLHHTRPIYVQLEIVGFKLMTCWSVSVNCLTVHCHLIAKFLLDDIMFIRWVLLLFGVAGIILGVSHPCLDTRLGRTA